jgi:hypothetical protein
MSAPDFAVEKLRAPEIDHDELEIDLLEIGIEPHQIQDIIEILEIHAMPLAAEGFRRMVSSWRASGIPRVAGLLRALELHEGETIRNQAARCNCAPSTIYEHEKRFREAKTEQGQHL